jgi:hypothetical protein
MWLTAQHAADKAPRESERWTWRHRGARRHRLLEPSRTYDGLMDARSFVVVTWTIISLVAALAVLVGTENFVYGALIAAFDVALGFLLFWVVGRLGIRPPEESDDDM